MSASTKTSKLRRAARLMMTRRYLYRLIAAIIAALIYYAWGQVTRTRGAQKVSFRPAEEACDTSGSLRYCVYRDRRGTNGDVVYHMHGRNLDERIWNDDTYMTALVQSEWQRRPELPPTVVTVSYGSTWLLTPKGKKPDSGLLDDLMARLPAIEAKIGRPRRRLLVGESMGGLNVLIAGLSYPSRFAKVAALCPGVYSISPFASLSTIRATMQRTGANPKIVFGVWMMARRYAANDAEWQRVSPLALIKRAGPAYPALYLSNGLYDAYGNFEGSQQLVEMARRRGVTTQWHPLYGGHCATDVASLAAFLSS
ncbi:alpha/beta hydrolase-fold protein [uncultured Sphingomonas sp.]|uniref:alpha/beta hydrolase-fold protein n=1 Tax=uncultured Sphingomonas sp. TaxID=158754 RepID=UPI0025E379BF|nr:alpha/beta hydrolase-fold protein [uncultured Sphingomonas sp.]